MITKLTNLAFTFLFIAAASVAETRANSYLFRLTGEEIDRIMSRYYPRGYDRDAVHRQMSEPFDCQNFDDLCGEVGADYALRIVEAAWTRARLEFPLDMISRAAEKEVESNAARWLEQSYPDGVPEKEPFWGQETGAASGGATCSGSAYADSGSFRVKQTSARHNLGPVVWGRSKVEHFKKNSNGKYKLERADRIEVSGNVFITVGGNDFFMPIWDVDYNARKVAATYAYGGAGSAHVSYVEGCGGVANSALWACSCTGAIPTFIP